jgi:hypothetical protein
VKNTHVRKLHVKPNVQRSTKRGPRNHRDGGRGAQYSPQFVHLYSVCREALRHGDTRLAETLLKSYRDEARRLRGRSGDDKGGGSIDGHLDNRRDQAWRLVLIKKAEEKAIALAKLLSKAGSELAVSVTTQSPTAETVVHARKKRDPLAQMRRNGRQEKAAQEIRHVFECMVRGLFAKIPDLNRVIERRSRPIDPVDLVSEKVAALRTERYLPWVREQQTIVAQIKAPNSPLVADEMTAIQLVIAVLIDLQPIGSLEKLFRLRHGTLGPAFRDSLDAYADVARFSREDLAA